MCRSLKRLERQHGRDVSETLRVRLILGATYCAVEDYEKAEPLLTRCVGEAKAQRAHNVAEMRWAVSLLAEAYFNLGRIPEGIRVTSEGKSCSGKIDSSAKDPLLEGFFQLALSLETNGDSARVQQGFAAALMALCRCMTHGFDRTLSGAQLLDGLCSFFKTYGLVGEEWEWVVKHAHLTKYDFVGLLSILLHHTGLAPEPVVTAVRARRRSNRVRYHYIGPYAEARGTSSSSVVKPGRRVDSPEN